MAKRKAPSARDDSSDSYQDASDASDVYEPARARTVTKRAAPRKKAKRAAENEVDEDTPVLNIPAHSSARHTVRAQRDAVQGALLAWYATVHNARNMPWRKPFDARATPEERAHRAYEVRLRVIALLLASLIGEELGMGVGNHAAADTGGDCYSVLE
jgi:A/G-specific adenine glycosylase